MRMSIFRRRVSLGCFYERCPYYKEKPHPQTNHTCEWAHPSCLRGKIDLQISLLIFILALLLETILDKLRNTVKELNSGVNRNG